MQLIKFKLQKDIVQNCLYFTPLYLNNKHPTFKNLNGIRINYPSKRVMRTAGYTGVYIDEDNFTIYISSDCDNNLNSCSGVNRLFMFNKVSGLDRRMKFIPPDRSGIEFWYNRIVQSFEIIAKYGKDN